MLFTITGKHIEITDAIRAHAKEKADKLPRFFDALSHVEVLLDASKDAMPTVEIIARAEHFGDIVSKETCPEAYAGIDMAFHKIERQLKKIKEKQRDHKRIPAEQ